MFFLNTPDCFFIIISRCMPFVVKKKFWILSVNFIYFLHVAYVDEGTIIYELYDKHANAP